VSCLHLVASLVKESEWIDRYGAKWPKNASDLQIEMAAIRQGGTWTKEGATCGLGLSHHYEQMRRILWPHLDCHRWHVLCRDEILRNKVTVLMGPGSCGKTHEAAWIYLCEYLVFPQETCVLVSSTEIRGLRGRVWAEITMLWQMARDKFPSLPGNLLDSRLVLCTDELIKGDNKKVRDIRRGIVGIPCVQNGKFVGLGKYSGWKQKRMRLIADEAQYMNVSFLSAFSNLDKNVDFRAVVLGNPNDPMDPLGLCAEPIDGWTNHLEPEKTSVWKTKFLNGTCVNLIGPDSPNFDFPADEPTRYPYLISREKIANTLSFFSKDSLEYYSQCIGVMKIGVLARRVITRDLCRQFQACENVIWKGTPLVKIYAVDAAYGGDRCVGGAVEFGLSIDGKLILSVHPPKIIPIRVGTGQEPEDQIAEYVRQDCETLGIPPENMFHDATGRGSLGTALARIWSAQTNPVEFGGNPTGRPVSLDLFILDPKTRQRRLMLCSEHYRNFVTELWYTIRYAIEAGQIRNLPEDVMDELCMRQWEKVNFKIQVEPKSGTAAKPGMKERTGRSPDLGDWLAIAVEGARRRGFTIGKLANQETETNLHWLEDLRRQTANLHRSQQLDYTA
jgi:hypothetical protein